MSAFVKDLPHPLLKLLLRDAKVRSMAIGSEHKMRKKLLLEIKAKARRTRQDPMRAAGGCSQDGWYVWLNETLLRTGLVPEQNMSFWEYAADGRERGQRKARAHGDGS